MITYILNTIYGFLIRKFNLPLTKGRFLKLVKVEIINNSRYGLCFAINNTLKHYGIKHLPIKDIIPLFDKNIAISFFNAKDDAYWWDAGVWDTGRMSFLNFLINWYYIYDMYDYYCLYIIKYKS